MAGEDRTFHARTTQGEAVMNLALALMREVKDDVAGLRNDLANLAKERREEAREHGALEVRLSTLEVSHKRNLSFLYTILGGLGLAYLVGKFGLK